MISRVCLLCAEKEKWGRKCVGDKVVVVVRKEEKKIIKAEGRVKMERKMCVGAGRGEIRCRCRRFCVYEAHAR